MASQDLKAENSADEAREVPVSEQTLLKAISWDTKFKNKSVEEVDEVMAQVTHLKLHGLSPPLTRVDDLTRFKALSVLYLYDNKINHIGSLAPCQDLTHLYLQNNNLESTEMIQVSTRDEARRPFSSFPATLAPVLSFLLTNSSSSPPPTQSLPKLKKLYVDCNSVSRISGLYGCSALEELHVSDQRLEPGTSLEFNNGSLASIGPSLKVFIAQGNNIDDVSKLSKLTELEEVDLSRNAIKESASLKDVFDKCKKLKKLSLLSNPVCKTSRGIEAEAILTCNSLEEFNNKEVTDQKRKCIQVMSTRKSKK